MKKQSSKAMKRMYIYVYLRKMKNFKVIDNILQVYDKSEIKSGLFFGVSTWVAVSQEENDQ